MAGDQEPNLAPSGDTLRHGKGVGLDERGVVDGEVRRITKRVKEYGAGKRQVTAGDVERFAEEAGVDREEEVRV